MTPEGGGCGVPDGSQPGGGEVAIGSWANTGWGQGGGVALGARGAKHILSLVFWVTAGRIHRSSRIVGQLE
jgi:hypothetical protein